MLAMNEYEIAVGDMLLKHGFEPYRPVKDKGVDFLAWHGETDRALRIQVKGSRAYGGPGYTCLHCGEESRGDGGGWFQLNISRHKERQDLADFYFFVWPRFGRKGRAFLDQCVIIPSPDSRNRIRIAGCFRLFLTVQQDGRTVYDLYGLSKKEKAGPLHGTGRDYGNYFQAWHALLDPPKARLLVT